MQDWVLNHKVLTSVLVVSLSGLTYYAVKNNSGRKKRRAKRASNGARLEVVVIAGAPSEPLVRSISLDLERRGFIVYIVCNSIEDEVLVQNESRQDIKPLMLDIIDVCSLLLDCSYSRNTDQEFSQIMSGRQWGGSKSISKPHMSPSQGRRSSQ